MTEAHAGPPGDPAGHPPFSSRVEALSGEGAYRVLARAQALEAGGREIVHFEIGQPDTPTPPAVCEAGIRAIREGRTRYTPPLGIGPLREAIAAAASARYGVAVRRGQVAIGPGAKPFLMLPALALLREGDEMLYPDPGFPTYPAMAALAGARAVPVPLVEPDGFAFDMEAFERSIGPRTRLVVLNSPANPTGGVLREAILERIAALAIERDFWVLSDEIYHRLNYTGRAVPSVYGLPGMRERTVVCDGFSKTYSMTGWRLGYAIAPERVVERLDRLLTHVVGCTAAFTQEAGLAALQLPEAIVGEQVEAYRARRDLMVSGLSGLPGFRCAVPGGAFYAFPNIRGTGRSSAWLADYFLETAGVAVLPGTAFGPGGEGYLRLCFATSAGRIEEGIGRMRGALAAL